MTSATELHPSCGVGHTVTMSDDIGYADRRQQGERGGRGRSRGAPDKTWLRHHAQRGMTQQQMVVAWEKESGIRVSRSAIAMAMQRHGVEAAKPRPRYEDMLPWHVTDEHKYNSQARLLRLEGRRRKGGKLTPRELSWLTTWRRELDAHNAVVIYDQKTTEGFHWVERLTSDDDVIRRPA